VVKKAKKRSRVGTSVTDATRTTYPATSAIDFQFRSDHQLQDPNRSASPTSSRRRNGPSKCAAPSPADDTVVMLENLAPPRDRHQMSSAWTTDQSSPPTRCGTSASSASQPASTSSRGAGARPSVGSRPSSSPSSGGKTSSSSHIWSTTNGAGHGHHLSGRNQRWGRVCQ
jgi:hypothetical protein